MSNNVLAAVGPTTSIDPGVLLKGRYNEVEILVFRVGDQCFGVNVAKVREVRNKERVLHLPRYPRPFWCDPNSRRGRSPGGLNQFPGGYDEDPQHDDQQADLLLEYNNRLVAFRVQGIDRVFRVYGRISCPCQNARACRLP